jgi:hypothetical protein
VPPLFSERFGPPKRFARKHRHRRDEFEFEFEFQVEFVIIIIPAAVYELVAALVCGASLIF